jgi:L-fuconolactonase
MIKIDSHQHFWHYTSKEYGWIDDSMSAIRRDFLPPDLRIELRKAGFDGSVSVQARESVEETRWLLELSKTYPDVIRGVVGWVPLASPHLDRDLSELAQNTVLKGVRHLVQGEPDDSFILGRDFNRGISQLLEFKLTFDILIFERHLSYASVFVDRHPNQIFVLDHIAKPKIAKHEILRWADHFREIAKRPNVFCKLSGMVTEADHKNWRKEDLAPYMDVALEAFGPHRLMFGSDWPVCLVATTYENWANLVKERISSLSQAEQDAILGGVAQRAYRL